MAEAAVAGALVLVEIVSVSLDHLNLKIDVKNDIKSIKSWLSRMKAFIEDHNQGSQSGSLEADQVEKVQDAAYEIEDVLEEFIFHSQPYKFHRHKITAKVHSYAHHVYHRFPHHGISKKIATIKGNLLEIKLQNETLPGNPGPSSSSTARIRRPVISPLLLDDEMIGYENPKKDFITRLFDRERNLLTLAAVGPVGSGKTTFVKNVFWKRGTYGKFDCHAWVYVSRHVDAGKLFDNMLQQFCSSRKEPCPNDVSLDPLSKLRNYLAGKRYIIVLDDVWGKEDWEKIKNAFPNTSRGSRVIVTTRSSDVAKICASSRNHMYSLNSLDWSEGWRLFCRKAFPEINGECPSELKDCAVRIVKRCEGLPLALVAVGCALSHKPKLPNEWERFHNSLGSEIRDSSDLSMISHALLPGYMDLSSNLKRCFLYFSIFPEDYSVERGRLIRLWVAERFAQETDGKKAEEVAEGYLNELIHRNLVHVSKWDFDGRPRNCRVLNLVLEFITQKCKEENFASIFLKRNTSLTLKIRRLCVQNDYDYFPKRDDVDGVRSMFLLRLLDISPSHEFENNLRNFKLLRILDLQGAPLTEFSKEITRLVLLRYLSFRDTKIKTIPDSIKKLFYLETLDLKQTDVRELPKEVSHLHNLCHLFAYKYNVENYVVFDSVQGVKVSGEISNLMKLQDFSLVEVDKKGGILKDLKNLIELRKLGLMGLKGEHVKDLCAAIEKMQKLTTLDLCSATKGEILELGDMENPPRTIERLYLKGRLIKFPGWILSLNSLLRIGLKWSKMRKSPLEALKHLPNLMELQMVDCYVGTELIFEASYGGFKKLKILLNEDLCQLHTVVVIDGAMPELKQFSIRKCPKLKMLPLGIENLGKVEELILHDVDEEMKVRIRMKGEDRWRVDHISVIHSFTLDHNRVVVIDGAMPELEQLSIRKRPKMMMLPLGIENLGKIEELILHDMDEEMKARIRMDGEDRWRVNRIPIVHSFTGNNGSWRFENLSGPLQQ